MKKVLLITAVVLMGIVMLGGCARKSGSGEITVYTALENELVDKYLVSFREHHPNINVNVVRDSTGIITARLLAEGQNTAADLVWATAASSLLVLQERGLVEPYAPKGIENVLPQFKDSANPPSWVGLNAWEAAFVYNTVEARSKNLPLITSYQDLLKPEFRGQIIMSNPASSGTGFLFVSGLIQLMGQEKAFEFLDALHNNIAMYTHSGSAPARRAGAGEFAVGISFGYAGVAQLNRGFPVEIIFPSEGSGWDVEANALIKKPEIKEAAKLFLDWSISMDAMNLLKEDYAIISVNLGSEIPAGYSKDPISQLLPNDLQWAAENRDDILAEWTRRYDGKTEAR